MAYQSSAVRPLGVKFESDLKDRLTKISEIKQRSVHWLMKNAIRLYVESEEANEQLKQTTLKRWEEAQNEQYTLNGSICGFLASRFLFPLDD